MSAALRRSQCVATLLLAAACAPTTPAPDAGPTREQMIAAADSLDRRYVEAFNSDDADALMAVYWNDPRLVSIGLDGSAPKGWDSTSAAWHASMDGNPVATLELLESHNEAVGKLVLGWGRWRLTTPSDSGPPQVLEGPYTDVKTFVQGRWVKVMDHASVAQP